MLWTALGKGHRHPLRLHWRVLVLRQDILVELSATESGHSCTAVEGSDHYPQQHGHLLLVWLPTSTRRSCPRLRPPIYPAVGQSTTDSTGHQF